MSKSQSRREWGQRAARLHAVLLCASACTSEPPGSPVIAPSLLDEVEPFIGTGGVGFGVGSIPPGPAHPFGLARPGPDTSTNRGRAPSFSHCAGYWWEDDEITAFSQIHLVGTGVPDYGALGLMPAADLPAGPLEPDDWRASFEHSRENARPGAYSVQLLPSGIGVEIAATPRTALYRIRYPREAEPALVVDLGHALGGGATVDSMLEASTDGKALSGWIQHEGMLSRRYGGFRLFFELRTDPPFSLDTVLADGERIDLVRTSSGARAGAILTFSSETEMVHVQVGLSFVDAAGAAANLDAEWMDFDLARAEAEAEWGRVLDRVELVGGDDASRRIFSTALFHSYGMPTLLSDVDGRYRGIDGVIETAQGWSYYSDFSLWDTFRTQHPLLTLLSPNVQEDMNRSMWAMTKASGRVPKWPLGTGETDTMIAYHGESVLVDSALKGVEGFDLAAAYEVLRDAALRDVPDAGRRTRDCAGAYLELGFCPVGAESGATSKTLEAAFGDFVLSKFAEHLERSDDSAQFLARSSAWSNLVDPSEGLIRGRSVDGQFPAEFRPDAFTEDFIEGNARQWTVFVPHDVAGWADALGGREAAVDWLDTFFSQAAITPDTPLPDLWYWHGNEPDIHAAFMFAELGRADLTRKWAAWVRETKYTDGPDGLDGNDDGGTLSAWYVFAALGLFPKIAEGRYVLSSPKFPEARLHLPAGELVIRAVNWAEGRTQVERITFDGEPVEGPFIEHQRLVRGGVLEFTMSP